MVLMYSPDEADFWSWPESPQYQEFSKDGEPEADSVVLWVEGLA